MVYGAVVAAAVAVLPFHLPLLFRLTEKKTKKINHHRRKNGPSQCD